MVDPVTAHRLAYRALFVALSFGSLFLRILPLDLMPVLPLDFMPVRFPGPDLMTAVTIAWVLRRPDYVPALLIALVFLLEDLVLLRPPGLWTAIILLGTEFLRSREATLRDLPIAVEWLVAAALIVAMTMIDRLVLALFLVPQVSPSLTALQVLATFAAYPFVVLATRFLFGAGRSAAGGLDGIGGRS